MRGMLTTQKHPFPQAYRNQRKKAWDGVVVGLAKVEAGTTLCGSSEFSGQFGNP